MKKHCIYFIFLLVLQIGTSNSFGQNAYYNALKIEFFVANSGLNLLGDSEKIIFNKFYGDPFENEFDGNLMEIINAEVVIDEFGNVFLKDNSALKNQSILTNGLVSVPISTQSAIIDGTAKFIAERFKEEVTTLYLDKFREKLEDIPELQLLYPKTYSFLKSADVFNYTSLGNDFKEAFEEDLKNTLSNLVIYIEGNANIKKELQDANLYYPFNFSLSLSDKLVKEYHPTEVLDFLEAKYKDDVGYLDYYNVVHGINIIQKNLQRYKKYSPQEFVTPQFENIWLSFSDLKKLDTPKKIQLFLGGIVQQDPNYFKSVMKINTTNANDIFKDMIYPVAEILNNIENYQAKTKLIPDDYIAIMENTLTLLKFTDKNIGNKLATIHVNGGTIDGLEFMDKIVDLYKSIYSKDYGYVVTNSLYLTKKIFEASGSSKKDIVKITQGISQYGGFMVDIVKSENSDDIKETIKKNVTKFSYLNKRNSRFNITLSAHPGVYGGFEWLSEVNENTVEGNIGITAPIGFEFMWSGSKQNPKDIKNRLEYVTTCDKLKYITEGSWSILASFADIGAVFNYRLNDTKSQLPAELTFKQVFSPGLSINRAFGNSPLTLGLGLQYTPELRNVTVDDITTLENSLRFMLRLSWDIPMVKIYSR